MKFVLVFEYDVKLSLFWKHVYINGDHNFIFVFSKMCITYLNYLYFTIYFLSFIYFFSSIFVIAVSPII